MTALLDAPLPTAGPAGGQVRGALDAATFDWRDYLATYPEQVLTTSRGRVLATRDDPLLFALIYFRHHLRSEETGGQITFSQFHLDLCEAAKAWARDDIGPQELREAWVAARSSGKSTWMFIILPLWALAHGHRHYVAAFADSATQAEQHLSSVKRELDTNAHLRLDFPNLCAPQVRLTGVTVGDHRSLFVAKSGAVMTARGIDSSILGAKVGSQRPDLLLFDDIEPSASNYSAEQKKKRLATILDAVLPMNDQAVVQFVGTTTMPGSIIHDLVKTVQHPDAEPAEWVVDERIRTRNYPALAIDDFGRERSIWPQRWATSYLLGIAHTRSFRLNMQNDPMAADGDFWTSDDIRYGSPKLLTGQLLSIDPAVTTKERSDYTAMAVIGFCKPERMAVVRGAWAARIAPGAALRERVRAILAEFPDTVAIVVEVNQAGDAWKEILGGLGVPVKTIHQHEAKEVRAARLLNHYQFGRVLHERALIDLESQLIAFPKGAYDDLVDAVGQGVEAFMGSKQKRSGVTQQSYV